MGAHLGYKLHTFVQKLLHRCPGHYGIMKQVNQWSRPFLVACNRGRVYVIMYVALWLVGTLHTCTISTTTIHAHTRNFICMYVFPLSMCGVLASDSEKLRDSVQKEEFICLPTARFYFRGGVPGGAFASSWD